MLDGPSGSGKSMIIERLRKYNPGKIKTIKKRTTRQRRASDNDYEFEFVDNIDLATDEWAFESVGNKYAIDVDRIDQLIAANACVAITCTDKNLANKLRSRFDACYVYVHRDMSTSELIELMRTRGTTSQSEISSRILEFESSVIDYSRNILLYDAVIINSGTPALAMEAALRIIFSEAQE